MNTHPYAHTIIIALCAFIATSCHRQLPFQLVQADSLLSVYDTTEASRMLTEYNSLHPQKSEKDSMYYSSLCFDLQNKQFITFSKGTDSLFIPIYKYYEDHGSLYDKMRANYLMGCIYRDLNWSTEAQRYFHKAIALSECKQLSQKDNCLLSCIYGQLGEIYRYRTDLQASVSMYKNALLYAKQSKNEDLIISSQMKLASCLMAEEKYRESIKYYHECLKRTYDSSNKYENIECILQLASNYIELGAIDSTRKYLTIFEKKMSIKPPYYYIEDKMNNYTYYTCKGQYLYNINKIDSARFFFYRLCHSKNPDYYEAGYNMLAECYDQLGQKDSVIKFLDLYSKALITDQQDLLNNQLQELQSNFDIMSERSKTHTAQVSKQKMFNYLLMTLSISLLVCILFIFVYELKKKRYRRLQSLYEMALHDISSQKQLYENLKKNGTTTDIAIISEKVQEAKERVTSIESEFSNIDLVNARLEQFKKNEVVHSFYQCATLHQKTSEKQWTELADYINNVAPAIMTFLRDHQYQMIEGDYKMCLLVVVGIAPKYIKNILFCSSQKISMQRKRLLKNLFDEEGTPSKFDYKLRSLK